MYYWKNIFCMTIQLFLPRVRPIFGAIPWNLWSIALLIEVDVGHKLSEEEGETRITENEVAVVEDEAIIPIKYYKDQLMWKLYSSVFKLKLSWVILL